MDIKELLYDIQREKEQHKQEELIENYVMKRLSKVLQDQAICANECERTKQEEVPDTWKTYQAYLDELWTRDFAKNGVNLIRWME